jgi:hypothetical protein
VALGFTITNVGAVEQYVLLLREFGQAFRQEAARRHFFAASLGEQAVCSFCNGRGVG